LYRKNLFTPLTVGYDWEMAVLKDTTESAGEEEIREIADKIRRRLPWARTGIDIDLLELRMVAISDWNEFKEKNRALVECAREIAKRKGYTILPIGARPTEQMPIGSHIHIGTVTDFPDAVRVSNAMTKYVPSLVALGCNSPFSRFDVGEFKSYRIIYNAENCSLPNELRIPDLARGGWGEDVQVRLPGKPTIEIRCLDSASSVDLMEEYVALLAGLVYGIGKKLLKIKWGTNTIRWQSINRFRAAKDGLQTIFYWNGKEVSAVETFKEVFSLVDVGIKKFGASIGDLRIINEMLKKRQTQSDFLLLFSQLDSDPHSLFRTIINILKDGDNFKKYLKRAKRLSLKKPPSIEDFILSYITKDVPYNLLYFLTPLTPHNLDRILARLQKEGKIIQKTSISEGKLYSKRDIR